MKVIKLLTVLFLIPGLISSCTSQGAEKTEKDIFMQYCESTSLSKEAQYTISELFKQERVDNCEALFIELSDFAYTAFWGKEITDFTIFKYVPAITRLTLSKNKIQDLSALSDMQRLTLLSLDENGIEDISTLSNMVNLTSLDLRNNQITDIRPLLKLKNLNKLYLSGNQINKESEKCPIGTDIVAINEFCFDQNKFISEFKSLEKEKNIDKQTFSNILVNIINNQELNIYYHADELPERSPLRVYVDNMPGDYVIELVKFGKPVQFISKPTPYSLNIKLSVKANLAETKFQYKPEGITGNMAFRYINGSWKTMIVNIFE